MTNDLESKLVASSSFNGDAVKTTSYNDDYRVRGNCFFADFFFTLGNTATKFFMFNPVGITNDKKCFVLPIKVSTTDSPLKINVYEDTDYTAGTVTSLKNANRNSLITAQSILSEASAGATKGTLLAGFIVGVAGIPAALSGGTASNSNPIILDTSKKYLVEIINTDVESDVSVSFTEFEIV